MKGYLIIILLASQIILGFLISKSYNETHKLAGTVRRILQIGLIAIVCNLLALVMPFKSIVLFSYSMQFVAVDWLLYFLFRFSMEYIGNVFEEHVKKNVLGLLLIADSIFMLLNNVFGHLFDVKRVLLFENEIYNVLDIKPLFYIHHVIALVLVVFCLISLFYRSVKAPIFYRQKYMLIALILLGLLGLNVLTIHSTFDFSVAGYVVEGICIYYCAFVYTPQRLLRKTLVVVARDMDVALYVMDIEGRKLYGNMIADDLFSERRLLVDGDGVTLEEWCRNQYLYYNEEFTKEKSFFRNNEELILKIQLQRMMDGKKQSQGGYFVIQDRTEEINKLKREKYLATHDTLTGLYNKEYFYEEAKKCIRRYRNDVFYMVCTDIKDFKMINDYFSSKVGDILLVSFADMLKEEKLGASVYGRLGNDVFAILIPKEQYDEQLLISEAQRAFSSCKDKSEIFPMINYIGVYEVEHRNVPVSVMCDRARMAIATIKGDYHKRIAYYDNELRDNILHEQELISELDSALEQEQFKMFLQPQANSKGEVLGAEALIRWFHPEKGQIMPGDFIPVFERNGLISDVDCYIWECACRQLRLWKFAGREDLYISVNISPRDFYFLNIYQVFVDLVNKFEINPKNLRLEITETAVVIDFERQLELITRLREYGFIVEMDDFGSGYSSLNMLKDIHVDVLKIDMAFLRKAEDEERSRKILELVIALSEGLGMPVITEGVETAEQVKFLSEMGCDIFQGYYFSKPISVEEFERLYMNECDK